MAARGRYVPVETLKRIARLARERKTEQEIAEACDVDRMTVRKYRPADAVRNPIGRPRFGLPDLDI